ncbi:hypothetical protein MSG28_004393 [Choristoneura fumiferana]|uniref:Uncharacterized protein n=1 Tax=Choristoneura fumiferana TaxID=7141 RepID=A0ACC0KIS5_CHOFU|nr:hypothetical protein MSG28_004393 [Choristoneura fumiferana]
MFKTKGLLRESEQHNLFNVNEVIVGHSPPSTPGGAGSNPAPGDAMKRAAFKIVVLFNGGVVGGVNVWGCCRQGLEALVSLFCPDLLTSTAPEVTSGAVTGCVHNPLFKHSCSRLLFLKSGRNPLSMRVVNGPLQP